MTKRDDGHKPKQQLHTFDVESDDASTTETAKFAFPMTVDGASVDDIDAFIRKKLEEGGGLLDLNGNLLTELMPPSPSAEEGVQGDTMEVAANTDTTPTGEWSESDKKTGTISIEELDEMALPFMETGAISVQPLSTKAQPKIEIGPTMQDKLAGDEVGTLADPVALGEVDDTYEIFEPGPPPQKGLPSGDVLPAGGRKPVTPADPMIGKIVLDRFEIVDLLGKGGMGKVFRARQLGLGRDVALKLLHPHLASERESRARFQREAQSMTRFAHPGIAAVYDFGEWEGQFFIAMEVLEGEPLSKRIPKQQGMPAEQIVPILEQVCDALAAAHQAGLVHRDLKPENIVLVDGDRVKLVDFGLAILKDTNEEERLTVEGMTIGTPHYMSPEQCQGMEVDQRSDIYALGCILYEMLCGEIPFNGDSLMAIMMQQLFAEPLPPSQRQGGADAHPVLEALALQAMSKEPDDRPADAVAFREALLSFQEDEDTGKRGHSIQQLASRDARASAIGIPHLSGRIVRAPTKFAEALFLVLEHPNHYAESLTMHLWSNGFTVKQVNDFAQLFKELEQHRPAGVVLDLRSDPVGLFKQLIDGKGTGRFGEAEIVVVGPEDSFDMMTLALEIGVFDYAPETKVKSKLPKSLRRLARRASRKKK